jgi:hypothetical protein
LRALSSVSRKRIFVDKTRVSSASKIRRHRGSSLSPRNFARVVRVRVT